MHKELLSNIHDTLMSKWNIESIARQYLTSKLDGSNIADEIDINELNSEEEHHLKNGFPFPNLPSRSVTAVIISYLDYKP